MAIVTGAASRGDGIGTGAATAMLCAREGATVVLVNRSEERAARLSARIQRDGGRTWACAADVTRPDDVLRMVRETVERFGRIDVLVNNVGVGARGDVAHVEPEDWNATWTRNVTSAMLCCKHCVPVMATAGHGSIVNISSVLGVAARKRRQGRAAYATTKAALVGLTYSLVADYSQFGIRSNCLVVGMLATPFVEHYGNERSRAQRRSAAPLAIEGTGWDVGHAVVFLASDEARFINGAVLPIDGGEMLYKDETGL